MGNPFIYSGSGRDSDLQPPASESRHRVCSMDLIKILLIKQRRSQYSWRGRVDIAGKLSGVWDVVLGRKE